MEKQLKLFRVLSLKEIALRRVGVLLCCNSDSRHSFWETYGKWAYPTDIKDWQNVVEAKMVELELPESLKKQIIEYVPAIGSEITKWRARFEWRFGLVKGYRSTDPSELCWTASGAIDDRKTAEQIVSCRRFRVEKSCEIACSYCLENCIPLFWEDLDEYRKVWLHKYPPYDLDLEFYWACIQRGELPDLDFLRKESSGDLTSFHQWAFEKAAYDCNQAATEYLFHHMTSEEKEASLMRSFLSVLEGPNDPYSDMFYYLLSVMTPEQQMEIVRTRPVDVLLCFLDWKRLHLFSENAGLIWPFITRDSYGNLLHLVFDLISETEETVVPRMLQELFEHCPLDFKEYFVDLESEERFKFMYFVVKFFEWNEPEFLRVMFTCLDPADRVKLVFSDRVLQLMEDSFAWTPSRWQMVEVCLREAALSEEDREKLKDAFTRFLNGRGVDGRFRRFFEFLGDVKKSRKRRPEGCCLSRITNFDLMDISVRWESERPSLPIERRLW